MTNILIVGAAGWPTLLGGAERSQGELAESVAAHDADGNGAG